MVLYESDRTDRENQEVAATGISLAAKDPCLFRGHSAATQAQPLLGGFPSLRHCGGTAVDSDSFASTSVGWSSQTMRTQPSFAGRMAFRDRTDGDAEGPCQGDALDGVRGTRSSKSSPLSADSSLSGTPSRIRLSATPPFPSARNRYRVGRPADVVRVTSATPFCTR